MNFHELTKFLTEKQSYLWAGVLTATALILLRKNGYAEGLENGVVTGVIAAGVFAGCLLVCSGAGWAIERVQKSRKAQKNKETADAAALKVFDDLFDEHRVALEYVATEIGKPNFKAGTERDLLAMVDVHLLEVDGPQGYASRGTYYKIRDVVWKRMVEEGWLKKKRWPKDMPPPWNQNWRI